VREVRDEHVFPEPHHDLWVMRRSLSSRLPGGVRMKHGVYSTNAAVGGCATWMQPDPGHSQGTHAFCLLPLNNDQR